MSNTTAQYLKHYAALSQPKLSKESNRIILRIEESVEAWTIALELLQFQDPTHGYHLLSRKLNHALPQFLNISELFSLLINKNVDKSVHWLVLAKLLLHTGSIIPLSSYNLPLLHQIKLLTEIPFACTHFKLPIDVKAVRKEYYQMHKLLIYHQLPLHPAAVIACLESFLQNGVKLQSKDILIALFQHPLQDICGILEDVFANQNYQQISNIILSFLQTNIDNQGILLVYLAYCKSLKLLSLELSQLNTILTLVFNSMKTGQFIQTYDFWSQIKKQLIQFHEQHKDNTTIDILTSFPKIKFFFECLAEVFKIVCDKSKLIQLPSSLRQQSLELSIDADDDEGCWEENPQLQENTFILKARDYSQDFIILVIETMRLNSHLEKELFSLINTWVNSQNLLQLQLVVFILNSSFSFYQKEETLYAMEILKTILQHNLPEYVSQKVIMLLGNIKMTGDVLSLGLQFLAKCLQNQKLSPLASESFCELVQNIDFDCIGGFIEELYSTLYSTIRHFTVYQNITKALTHYLFKFKNANSYLLFLQSMNLKHLSPYMRLEGLFLVQLWLNNQPQSKEYLNVFATYLQSQLPILWQIFTTHEDHSKAIRLINLAIKTGVQLQEWNELVKSILSRYNNAVNTVMITPLVNLIKITKDHNPSLVALLKTEEPRLTLMLLKEKNLQNHAVLLHLAIVKMFLECPNNTYAYEGIAKHLCQAMDNRNTLQYELSRNTLMYFIHIIQLGYDTQEILLCLFRHYRQIQELLWNSLEGVLFAVYKQRGMSAFKEAFGKAKIDMLNEGWQRLTQAFRIGQGHAVKNILLSYF